MKVINIYGSAGAGKSTNAAGLAYELKKDGFKVELVTEFAKELCITKTEHLLENQIWVFGNQYHKMKYLSDDLDFIITDSPIMLSAWYGKKYNYQFESLYPLIKEVHNSFDNINIFLKRAHAWDPYARVQTEQESEKDSTNLQEFLKSNDISFEIFETGRYLPAILKKYILDTNHDIVEKHHNMNLKSSVEVKNNSTELEETSYLKTRKDSFEIQKSFFEDFEKIENDFIGLLLTEVNRREYFYKVRELKRYYKALSNINFETPPSKLDWTPYKNVLKNNLNAVKEHHNKIQSMVVPTISDDQFNSINLCGND